MNFETKHELAYGPRYKHTSDGSCKKCVNYESFIPMVRERLSW